MKTGTIVGIVAGVAVLGIGGYFAWKKFGGGDDLDVSYGYDSGTPSGGQGGTASQYQIDTMSQGSTGQLPNMTETGGSQLQIKSVGTVTQNQDGTYNVKIVNKTTGEVSQQKGVTETGLSMLQNKLAKQNKLALVALAGKSSFDGGNCESLPLIY